MIKINILDNFKINTKLIFTYIFCVLIPLLVTNTVIIVSTNNYAKKEQQVKLEKLLDSLEYNLSSAVEGCVTISKDMYMDDVLNKFLHREFGSTLDYFVNYNKLLQNNIIHYYYTSQKVYEISIYVDNDTIVNGGHFFKTDSIRSQEWFQAFQESKHTLITYVYYDKSKRYLPNADSARTISVIRALGYHNKDDKNNLIKIDLDYNEIERNIANSQFNGMVYVCNEDYIIFTNKEKDNKGYKNFESKDSIDLSNAIMKKNVKILSQDWSIYIMTDKHGFWTKLSEITPFIFLFIFINLLLPTAVITLVGRSIGARINLTGYYMNRVKKEQFDIIECKTGEDEIGQLIKNYNHMVIKIKELIEVVLKGKVERQELLIAKKQAELNALQSQINPHFMFNTLESIRMRSLLKGEQETADIIGELSILLRKSINWGHDTITIAEEMAFVDNYLSLQKYRFGDKLNYYFNVMDNCKEIKIPKLTILTFIENACIHGIEGIARDGIINVTVSSDDHNLYIEISDTGCGVSKEKLESIKDKLEHANIELLNESSSTGMLNAFIRLKMFCNESIQIDIDSEEGCGMEISLLIPRNESCISNYIQ